jgi:hypothetical protein
MIFAWFCRSNFPICLTIICMAIPIVFFSSLSTWRFQNYFVRFKYTIRGPIGRSVISFNSHSHYSPYNDSPPYLCFPFVVNDTNIVGLALDVVLVFFMIWARIFNIRFFNVNQFISLLFGFLTFDSSFHILGALVGSKSFVKLFVAKALHEDLGTIFNLIMFADLHEVFAMFLLSLLEIMLFVTNHYATDYHLQLFQSCLQLQI